MPAEKPQTIKHEPLWERIDRNRLKMLGFIAVFVTAASVLVSASLTIAPTWAFAIIGLVQDGPAAWDESRAAFSAGNTGFVWVFPVLFVWFSLYSAMAVAGSGSRIASLVSAVPVPSGDEGFAETRKALHDIAIATGLSKPPALYALVNCEDGAINGCSFGTMKKPAIAVTSAFARDLSLDQQRALLAALLARVESGDVMRISAFLSITRPLIWIRDHDNPFNHRITAPLGIMWEALSLSAHALALLKNRGAWLLSEKADAEAMLRSKDPRSMLSAVDRLATSDTRVPLDPIYGGLFLAPLTGTEAITPDEEKRLLRLRQVLGTEGGAYSRSA